MKKLNEMVENDNWTPVLKGKTYCSPACGHGCTKSAYDQAVRDANALVKKLRGEGWKPEVWENSGWHFKAMSGPVQVYGDRYTRDGSLRFSCLIADNAREPSGGSCIWTTKSPARAYADPNQAVMNMFRDAVLATSEILDAVHKAARAAGMGGLVYCPPVEGMRKTDSLLFLT
jgi:hypothetical protein